MMVGSRKWNQTSNTIVPEQLDLEPNPTQVILPPQQEPSGIKRETGIEMR